MKRARPSPPGGAGRRGASAGPPPTSSRFYSASIGTFVSNRSELTPFPTRRKRIIKVETESIGSKNGPSRHGPASKIRIWESFPLPLSGESRGRGDSIRRDAAAAQQPRAAARGRARRRIVINHVSASLLEIWHAGPARAVD